MATRNILNIPTTAAPTYFIAQSLISKLLLVSQHVFFFLFFFLEHLDDSNANEKVLLNEIDLVDYSDLDNQSFIGKLVIDRPQFIFTNARFKIREKLQSFCCKVVAKKVYSHILAKTQFKIFFFDFHLISFHLFMAVGV